MDIDHDGNKTHHTFYRALMKSAASLSYEDAQDAFDGMQSPKTDALLEPVIKPLFAAYAALTKARERRKNASMRTA